MDKEIHSSRVKEPTTYEQQVQILEGRRLEVTNRARAIRILQKVSYYRLSAYMLTLKQGEEFVDGTTFETIFRLYEFDRKLRQLLVGILESVEIALRSHICYVLAHRYGALGYLDDRHFVSERYHRSFIEEVEKAIRRRGELFIEHHHRKYNGKFPAWVATELMSFGVVSKLFANMQAEDKKQIAKDCYGVPYLYIESWARSLAYVRNICAHYGRLYDRVLVERPRLDKKDKARLRNDRVFSMIFVAGKLLRSREEWGYFLIQLEALVEQYDDVIQLDRMGFPEEWEILLRREMQVE